MISARLGRFGITWMAVMARESVWAWPLQARQSRLCTFGRGKFGKAGDAGHEHTCQVPVDRGVVRNGRLGPEHHGSASHVELWQSRLVGADTVKACLG